MNKKNAFKILSLEKGASLVDAKRAYHHLAKQYHPDRFDPESLSLDNMDNKGENLVSRLNQMKQINRAFHFLAPLLPCKKVSPGNGFFLGMVGRLRKRLVSEIHEKTASKPRVFVKHPPRYTHEDRQKQMVRQEKIARHEKMAWQRQMANQKKNPGHNPGHIDRFDTILNVLCPGSSVGAKNKQGRERLSQVQPYGNFLKHMALKKIIMVRTRNHDELNCSRVEKIHPVTSLNSIGEE